MPKKQHLYLFGTYESFGFEINRSVTLKYLNRFVIEEDSQTDIIQSYLEMYPYNYETGLVQSINPLSFFYSNSDLSIKKPLNDRILNAMKTAAILEDNETQNHFIFESSLLRRSILRPMESFQQPFRPLYELIKRSDLKETMVLQKSIKEILRSLMNLTPNIILVTCLDGYRHRITREATLSTDFNDWYSFLLRKFNRLFSFNQGGDLFNWSILGDDVDRLTNGLKAGFQAELEVNENIRTVNRFYSHQMLSNDEVVKIQSGDESILKDFAYSLLDKQTPSFDRIDQLFVEIFCVRSTFIVNKFNS